jgi:hypothetical protein
MIVEEKLLDPQVEEPREAEGEGRLGLNFLVSMALIKEGHCVRLADGPMFRYVRYP